jgi:hypothetical protein
VSTVEDVIEAAEDLAWRPTYNIPGRGGTRSRMESSERLCAALMAWSGRLPANAPDELRYLIAAIRRAAGCSYSNRKGPPYYERRQAIYQLRGCLDVWKRSVAA